jgi:RNA polymerase sigma factor (sigma-70 family)
MYGNLLLKKVTIHSPEKQKELIAAAQQGDLEARNDLIETTMPFVINMAVKINKVRKPQHIELDDLIQAGVFGLIRAIKKFDLGMENKFLSYASYWIRNKIDREIHNCRAYKIPQSVRYQYDKGIVKSELTRASVKHFQEMTVVDHNDVSEGCSGEILDEKQKSPDENADVNERICFLHMVIDDLDDERHSRAIRMRMEGAILKDIGTALGFTRERARQIIDGVEKKLRDAVLDQRHEWAEDILDKPPETVRFRKKVVGAQKGGRGQRGNSISG